MGLLGFESKAEKQRRLEELDRKNEQEKLQAEKKGLPFIGVRYEDDYRGKW